VVNQLTFSDLATGRLIRLAEWDDLDNVQRVAYSPEGKSVATVSSDGTLRLWDVVTL
jgi:WD40 repeat protein